MIQRVDILPLGDGSYKLCPDGKPQKWVWVKDAARLMGVSPESVRNWIGKGYLISRRVGLRKYQVQMESLEAFLKPYNHLE